jgi:16S rRNA (uracil1498-N3)-methyltransferase
MPAHGLVVLLSIFDFMALPIFFLEEFVPGEFVTLNEDTSKHVVQVLRMTAGEALQLTDGHGNLLTTSIADAHKRKCSVRVVDKSFQPKPARQVSVAISLLKNASRFEWFLEKATEIGVTDIVPLLCERTEKQHFRYERMNQIVIAAMMQSQQVWLPVLHQPTVFTDVINSSSYQQKLIAHCEHDKKLDLREVERSSSMQILIGPEGDFSPAEITAARARDYQPVSLGDTRLRAETAGIVAATFLCI